MSPKVEGTLETQFGNMPILPGDYLVIHRGILHRYHFTKPAKLLIMESRGYVRTPSRYRNDAMGRSSKARLQRA